MRKWQWSEAYRRLAASAALMTLGFLAGIAARYLFVQTPELAWACSGADDPWWCALREALIEAFRWQGLGLIAIVAGAIALLRRTQTAAGGHLAAALAMATGAAGLFLYAPELSAAGLLLGLLRMTRA